MKKYMSLILAVLLVFSLAACDGTAPANSEVVSQPENAHEVSVIPTETPSQPPEGMLAICNALQWPPTGKVAVKLSTGEPPASNYLRPELIADVVKEVDGTIVECNTAYGGSRSQTAFTEAMAEAGKSISDYLGNGERIVYINVLNNISIDCDGSPTAPGIHHIGILASADPVAIGQASIDLAFAAEGSESLRYVPSGAMTALFGGNEAFGVLTGPSAKITNLGALKIVLGIKHFALYIAFVIVFAVLTGSIVNLAL